MDVYRRSWLQIKILTQLDIDSAKTLVDLAERVNSQRSSVSRSIRSLKEQGLVYRDRKGWHLTDDGIVEAKLARESIAEAGQDANSSLARFGEIVDTIPVPLMDDRLAKAFEEMAATVAKFPLNGEQLSGLVKDADVLLKQANTSILQDLSRQGTAVVAAMQPSDEMRDTIAKILMTYQESMSPLVDLQERYSQLVRPIRFEQFACVQDIVRINNVALDRIAQDAVQIRDAILRNIDVGPLLKTAGHISEVIESLQQVSVEQIDSLASLQMGVACPDLSRTRFTAPANAVVHYTGTLREYVLSIENGGRSDPSDYRQLGADHGDVALDDRLAGLDDGLVEMRNGAWDALNSGNRDRLRHAAVSHRTLVENVFRKLVPGSVLPEDNKQGLQMRARLREIYGVSSSDAKQVDSFARAWIDLYHKICGFVHGDHRDAELLRGLILMGEAMLTVLFAITQHRY